MSTELETMLKRQVSTWERLGHPAIIERFVLRNGRAYEPMPRIGRKMRNKECFSNTTKFILRQNTGTYIEGYGYNIVMPILHAWVSIDDKAMDPTWKYPMKCQYFGVEFSEDELHHQIFKNGYFGILDGPTGINYKFIFGKDNELKEIVEDIIHHKINMM